MLPGGLITPAGDAGVFLYIRMARAAWYPYVYINASVFSINSHPVKVNALKNVVIITTLEVRTPSWPIFLAITKQLTVVAEPAITRIATSASFRKPRPTAAGRSTAAKPTSFRACRLRQA